MKKKEVPSIEELRNTCGCSEKNLQTFLVHINFSSEYCSNCSRFLTPRLKNKNKTQPEKFLHIFPKTNMFLILLDGTFQRQAQKEKKNKIC